MNLPGVAIEGLRAELGPLRLHRGRWRDRSVDVLVPAPEADAAPFLADARLWRRLSHVGVPRCLEVVEAPAALLLEPMEGESLAARLERAPLPPELVLDHARALLGTLSWLHHHGVLLQALSPLAVWLGPKLPQLLPLPRFWRGHADPTWLSPEQLVGRDVDHRADLYALGTVLYAAVVGAPPYSAESAAAWLAAHHSGAARRLVDRVPDAPAGLFALVERLMAVDAAHRPVSAAAALDLGGSPGALRAARLVGRAGAEGAVQALVDGGGLLRVSGEIGSGVQAVLSRAAVLAAESELLVVHARVEPAASVRQVAEAVAAGLGVAGVSCQPTSPAVAETLAGLDRRYLLAVADVDLASDRVVPWLASLGGAGRGAILLGGFRQRPDPKLRQLNLRPLDLAEMRALLVGMLGTAAAPPGLDVHLHRRTGGLPGLAVTVVREMVRRGALSRTHGAAGAWDWDPGVPVTLGGAQAPILARWLGDLGTDGRAALDMLAAADGRLPTEVASATLASFQRRLDVPALRARGLVWTEVRDGEEWVVLRGPLTWLLGQRARDPALHAAIAAALRNRPVTGWDRTMLVLQEVAAAPGPGTLRELVELADHLSQGGRADVAMELVARVPPDPGAGRPLLARIAAVRAEALLALGRPADAETALQAAAALDAEEPTPGLDARLACVRVDVALAQGHDVRSLAPSLELPVPATIRARQALLRAEVALRRGLLAEAERLVDRAVDAGLAPQTDRVAWRARAAAIELAVARGQLARAEDRALRLVRELESGPLARELAGTLSMVIEVQAARGALGSAVQHVQRATEVAERARAPFAHAAVVVAHAGALRRAGDLLRAGEVLGSIGAFGSAQVPYALRVRWLGAVAEQRLATAEFGPALAACVLGGEAAAGAGDPIHEALFAGLAAALNQDLLALSRALEELDRRHAVLPFARVGLAAARYAGFTAPLPRAEHEARRAGDRLLLMELLDVGRPREAAEELREIVAGVADGLFGGLRERFLARPDVVKILRRKG